MKDSAFTSTWAPTEQSPLLRVAATCHSPLVEITARALHWRWITHEVTVIVCFLQSAGVWEEQHLGVGVDGDVELHRFLVAAQEVGHGATFWLRLGEGAAVDLSAGLTRGALSWKKSDLLLLDTPEQWGAARGVRQGLQISQLRDIVAVRYATLPLTEDHYILTAPVGIKVSVQVNPDAAASLAHWAIFPPHSVLDKETEPIPDIFFLAIERNCSEVLLCAYRSPGVVVAVRVQHRQDVDVHTVQDGGDVPVPTILVQRLRNSVIHQFSNLWKANRQRCVLLHLQHVKMTHMLNEPQTEGMGDPLPGVDPTVDPHGLLARSVVQRELRAGWRSSKEQMKKVKSYMQITKRKVPCQELNLQPNNCATCHPRNKLNSGININTNTPWEHTEAASQLRSQSGGVLLWQGFPAGFCWSTHKSANAHSKYKCALIQPIGQCRKKHHGGQRLEVNSGGQRLTAPSTYFFQVVIFFVKTNAAPWVRRVVPRLHFNQLICIVQQNPKMESQLRSRASRICMKRNVLGREAHS